MIETSETDALIALDRLNGWVRSDSYRKQYFIRTGPRQAVYDMKGVALAQAIDAGVTTHRRVMTSLQCRDCHGTGRYTDNWGFEHPHCWNCCDTGKKVLRFLESTIAERFVWHTPWERVSLALRDRLGMQAGTEASGVVWHASFDWSPGRTGQDLGVVEVAEALLLVEQAFPYVVQRRARYDSRADKEEQYRGTYWLYIGETARQCCFCGTPDGGLAGIHGDVDRLTFHTFVCQPCSRERGRRMWDEAVCPPEFLAQEAIQEWRARHPRIQKERSASVTHD